MIRTPRTELRILSLSPDALGKDPIADGWNTKIVMVTGWYLMWQMVGWDLQGGRVFRPVWKAKVMEVPDRFFSEAQLLRIM